MTATFTAAEVVAYTAASYRQVDYWARTQLVTPSLRGAAGSGSQRLYSYDDLWRTAICRQLVDSGVGLLVARQVLDQVCDGHPVPLTMAVTLHVDVAWVTAGIAERMRTVLVPITVKPTERLRLVPA